jgi:hypothetical protein
LALSIGCAAPALSVPGADPADDAAASALACTNPRSFRFVPDTGDAAEAYLCFGFDAGAPAPGTIAGVRWSPPDSESAYQIHHALLYAVPSDYPDGPVACDGMPAGSVGLHMWSPGGSDLALPADTALQLPQGTVRFVVQAHILRLGSGAVEDAGVTLCEGPPAPAHLAAFFGYASPVPAIRPMHVETSMGSCALSAGLHLWSVWPHMHLAGKEIAVDLLRGDGTATALVDVNPWNFHQQRTYPLSVDTVPGDKLETHCTWQNTTDQYILPGPRTEDEMCTTALIVWPADGVSCQ